MKMSKMPTVWLICHLHLGRRIRRPRRGNCLPALPTVAAFHSLRDKKDLLFSLNPPVLPLLRGGHACSCGEKTMILPASGRTAVPVKTEGRRLTGR